MIRILKEEIELSSKIKSRIDWAKNFTRTNPTLEKGKLIVLEPTNIAYVEPHKLTIKDNVLLFFNGNDYFYLNDLNTQYKLTELESIIKSF